LGESERINKEFNLRLDKGVEKIYDKKLKG